MTDITVQDRLEALAILAETRLERIEKQQAEIERLRGELIKERLLVRHIDQVDAALAANQEQEIERLHEARHQALEAGDAARREVNRLHARLAEIEAWQQKGEDLVDPASSWGECVPSSTMFKLGNWWANRPWR
jgi:hypothetical protein